MKTGNGHNRDIKPAWFDEKISQNDIQQLVDDDIRLLIIGDRTAFDRDLQDAFTMLNNRQQTCTRMTLTVGINYGVVKIF